VLKTPQLNPPVPLFGLRVQSMLLIKTLDWVAEIALSLRLMYVVGVGEVSTSLRMSSGNPLVKSWNTAPLLAL